MFHLTSPGEWPARSRPTLKHDHDLAIPTPFKPARWSKVLILFLFLWVFKFGLARGWELTRGIGDDSLPACFGGNHDWMQLRPANQHLLGHIHAFYLIWRRMEAEERYGAGGFQYVGNGQYEPLYIATHQQPAQPHYGATHYQ
ncbi:hypothetical protein CTheo_7181 [Ceratobasidium theobromae]|uniref:Uncharacterized protein n=1 Tax=Ceratobasidium theobromae TaxID=1582974 RepID=A0A5N5QCX8_9AGAM|nr:hypothetical protein CTheo_7181 [Ceratobasidium theobromae]